MILNEYKYKQYTRYINEPWLNHYYSAQARCNAFSSTNYIDYGYLGIKLYLTKYEIKILWNKYKVFQMRDPTIDRIDPLWHYTYNNCQFLERAENSRRAMKMYRYTHMRKNLDIFGDWSQLEKLKEFSKNYPNFDTIRLKDSKRYNIPIILDL